jgi:hypothetical protein
MTPRRARRDTPALVCTTRNPSRQRLLPAGSAAYSYGNMGVLPTVVALTSFPFRQYRFQCIEVGADFVLDKATEFEYLAEICSQERVSRPF